MTRLPLESRDVRGMPGPPYEGEEVCSHPFCDVRGRENLELHEIWPRSFLRGQPYRYVRLPDGRVMGNQVYLCNAFTNGHHPDVTENRARIVFVPSLLWFAWVTPGLDNPQNIDTMKNPDRMNQTGLGGTRGWLSPQPPLEAGPAVPQTDMGGVSFERADSADGHSSPVTASSPTSAARSPHSEGVATTGSSHRKGRPEPIRKDGSSAPSEYCSECKRKLPSPHKKHEPKKARTNWSVRVPKDVQEDGVEVIETLLEEVRKALGREKFKGVQYFVLVEALAFVVQHSELIEREAA